jgi:hypothetical protein
MPENSGSVGKAVLATNAATENSVMHKYPVVRHLKK